MPAYGARHHFETRVPKSEHNGSRFGERLSVRGRAIPIAQRGRASYQRHALEWIFLFPVAWCGEEQMTGTRGAIEHLGDAKASPQPLRCAIYTRSAR